MFLMISYDFPMHHCCQESVKGLVGAAIHVAPLALDLQKMRKVLGPFFEAGATVLVAGCPSQTNLNSKGR